MNLTSTLTFTRTLTRTAPGNSTISAAGVEHETGRNVVHCVILSNLFDDPATGTTTTSVGATCTIKVQGSDDNSAFTDIGGATISVPLTDRNKMVLIELAATVYRYSRVQVVRNANFPIGIDGAFTAQVERAAFSPNTQGTNVTTPIVV